MNPPSMTEFFNKLSKKVGLNIPYFLTSSFWVVLRYSLLGILSLVTSIGFARLGSQTLYGQYQFVISLVSFFSVITLPGLNIVALKAVVNNLPGIIRDTARLCFRLSLVVGIVIILIGAYYLFKVQDTAIGWAFISAGIFVPFFYGPNGWYTFYEGKLDFASPTQRVLLMNGLVTMALLYGLWHDWPLIWLIAAYFAITSLLTSLYYLQVSHRIPHKPQPVDMKAGINYTLQKWTLTLPETLQPLILTLVYDFATLGSFLIAYTLVNSAVGLVGALASTYFPLLMKYKQLPHKKIIMQNLAIGFVLASAYFVVVRFAFVPLYGANNTTSYQLAQYFSGIVLFLPLKLYFSNYFTAHARHKPIIISSIISYSIAVVVFFVLSNHMVTALVSYLYTSHLVMIGMLGFSYLRSIRQPTHP
jgi:O-antigen/teichoic acid export membrane protein